MPPPGQGSGQSETGGWLVEPLSDFEVELLLINDNNKKVSDRGRHIFKIVESNRDLGIYYQSSNLGCRARSIDKGV